MDITRIAPRDKQHIKKYGPQGFVVSGVEFPGPILVFAQESLAWDALSPQSLTLSSFDLILERSKSLDLCLIGTGDKMHRVSKDIKNAFKENGLNIEAMDTGAACRTFNVLLAEGRAVAAALFPTGV